MNDLAEQALEEMLEACMEDPTNLAWFEGFAAATKEAEDAEGN